MRMLHVKHFLLTATLSKSDRLYDDSPRGWFITLSLGVAPSVKDERVYAIGEKSLFQERK